jgi:hypothetical protein
MLKFIFSISIHISTNHFMNIIIDNSFSDLKIKEKTFKILTFNVLGFQQNKKHISNISLLTEFLSKLDLDFIGLQVLFLKLIFSGSFSL